MSTEHTVLIGLFGMACPVLFLLGQALCYLASAIKARLQGKQEAGQGSDQGHRQDRF